jgi:hypothetical protein
MAWCKAVRSFRRATNESAFALLTACSRSLTLPARRQLSSNNRGSIVGIHSKPLMIASCRGNSASFAPAIESAHDGHKDWSAEWRGRGTQTEAACNQEKHAQVALRWGFAG